MPKQLSELSSNRLLLLFICVSAVAWAENNSQFSVKEFHRDSDGVTFTTTAGIMRIEVCGDRTVHVIAGPTSEIPKPKVPVVIQPCKAQTIRVTSNKTEVKISTEVHHSDRRSTDGCSELLKKGRSAAAGRTEGGRKSI